MGRVKGKTVCRGSSKVKQKLKCMRKKKRMTARCVEPDTAVQNSGKQHVKLNSWSEWNMKCAIQEFMTTKCQLRTIARAWQVPKSTLERRVKGKVIGHTHLLGKTTYFTKAQELQLEQFLLDMARRGFPLTERDVRYLAYQFALKNSLTCLDKFCAKTEMTGYYWLKGFLSRHPMLSVKKPEGLSAARASAMNKPVVNNWFNNYEKLLSDLNIKELPSHVWNLDESGFQDYFVPHGAVGESGAPLYNVTGGEKGEHVTVLPVFNAIGEFGPLMVIFKGAKTKTDWAVGSPPNSLVRCSKDGYINTDLFCEFGEQFVKFIKDKSSDASRKHVLLMDGHGSHVYNVKFLSTMKENGIEVVCFPPHTTHVLQPADKALFKAAKSKWEEAGRGFVKATGGKRITKNDFFKVFTPVWEKVATVGICQSAFRATGLFPCNRSVIPESAFMPSVTTDRELCDTPAAAVVTEQCATLSTASEEAVATTGGSTEMPLVCQDLVQADVPENVEHRNVAGLDRELCDTAAAAVVTEHCATLSIASAEAVVTTGGSTEMPLVSPDLVQADVSVSVLQEEVTACASSSVSPVECSRSSTSEDLKVTNSCGQPIASSSLCTVSGTTVSFYDIQKPPTRQRHTVKRKRPPSQNLTSTEHFKFLSETSTKKKTEKKKKTDKGLKCKSVKNDCQKSANKCDSKTVSKQQLKKNVKQAAWFCCVCKEDRKADMRRCAGCSRWMHDECLGLTKKDKGNYCCVDCD